jgi:hypothetical protein
MISSVPPSIAALVQILDEIAHLSLRPLVPVRLYFVFASSGEGLVGRRRGAFAFVVVFTEDEAGSWRFLNMPKWNKRLFGEQGSL